MDALAHGFFAFGLADVPPGGLHVGDFSAVHGFNVGFGEVEQLLAVEVRVLEHFGFDAPEDLLADGVHLLQELGSELGVLEGVELLELALELNGAHHGHAVAFAEEVLDHAANAVFLFDLVGEPALELEGVFEVLLGGDGVALGVDHLEGEIAHDPEELGEEAFAGVLDFLAVVGGGTLARLTMRLMVLSAFSSMLPTEL